MRRFARSPSGNVALVRPFLGWRHVELEEVCALAGVTPFDDPSNDNLEFERVRVRQGASRGGLARSRHNQPKRCPPRRGRRSTPLGFDTRVAAQRVPCRRTNYLPSERCAARDPPTNDPSGNSRACERGAGRRASRTRTRSNSGCACYGPKSNIARSRLHRRKGLALCARAIAPRRSSISRNWRGRSLTALPGALRLLFVICRASRDAPSMIGGIDFDCRRSAGSFERSLKHALFVGHALCVVLCDQDEKACPGLRDHKVRARRLVGDERSLDETSRPPQFGRGERQPS